MESFLELMNAEPATDPGIHEIKIGLISNGGMEPLAHMLTVLFSRQKIKARIFLFPFESYLHPTEEFLKSHEALGLKYVILFPLTQDQKLRYYQSDETMWTELETVIKRLGKSQLLVSSLVLPLERNSFSSFVMKFNDQLSALANQNPNVTMVDVDRLAGDLGRREWFDQRSWLISKFPCSPTMLPQLAHTISPIIASREGKIIKCIVLDADQVLWPEIVDEVGAENILSPENPESQACIEFQYYLAELFRRGIFLAVCSKNEKNDIKKIFTSHPGMVLKENAIASFQVSWTDKAEGIRNIARELNIGLDSLLFLDDSAFEREFIRRELPEVIVPEISADSSHTIRVLSELNLFPEKTITKEDKLRNSQRAPLPASGEGQSTEEFLRDLKMKGIIRLADEKDLSRLVQLFQRSNQFNMMTARYSPQEISGILASQKSHIVTLDLSDRLGELGMISALILEREENTLEISDWVFSCRAFSRNLEQSILRWLSDRAQVSGCKKLRGRIVPNERNLMARQFYEANGFHRSHVTMPEYWELELPYAPSLSFALKPVDEINEDLWKKKFCLN
ncbi:MAG: HAD-IIIC family phosphatase [Bacteriovoracaceae bacterium]